MHMHASSLLQNLPIVLSWPIHRTFKREALNLGGIGYPDVDWVWEMCMHPDAEKGLMLGVLLKNHFKFLEF